MGEVRQLERLVEQVSRANAKIALSKRMLEAALDFPAGAEIVGMYVTDDPEFLYLKLYDPHFEHLAGVDDLDTVELPLVHRHEVLP